MNTKLKGFDKVMQDFFDEYGDYPHEIKFIRVGNELKYEVIFKNIKKVKKK